MGSICQEMSGKIVLILLVLAAIGGGISIQKRFSPLFFSSKFWRVKPSQIQIEINVAMKEPLLQIKF